MSEKVSKYILNTNESRKSTNFVLICNENCYSGDIPKIKDFLQNLEKIGFEIEMAHFTNDESKIIFKLHTPDANLHKFAKIFDIKLAFENKESNIMNISLPMKCRQTPVSIINLMLANGEFPVGITSGEKSSIIYKILTTTQFGDGDGEIGIKKLIKKSIFEEVYPLHDGDYAWDIEGPINDRQLLAKYWGNIGSWYKEQPLNFIEKYYGAEYALYFAWLGFYIKMLIPLAIAGFGCFIMGLATFKTKFNERSGEVCESNVILCPKCNVKNCKFEMLNNSCFYTYLTYLFDNDLTILLAVITSIWATVFMELWNRKVALLQLQWNLKDVELDSSFRPEFEENEKHRYISEITGKPEPYIPMKTKCYRYTITFATIILLIILVIICLLGVLVYRIAISRILIKSSNDNILQENVSLIVSITGALISVALILILELVYTKIALWLTELENPRTEYEFDNSFIYKSYALAFVNNYAVIFYIAFFKGRFYTHPGDAKIWTTLGGIQTDLCEPAGCVADLGLQLLAIMIVRNVVSNIQQVLLPVITVCYNKMKSKKKSSTMIIKNLPQWERDYLLISMDKHYLIREYMQMVIQYGFVTFFIAGFPLAPLLALINNIIELRVDAFKLTRTFKRPIVDKVGNLGAWTGILQAITYTGIVTNAFVIAFTSDFVPRKIYKYEINRYLKGYVNSTLSAFATKDLPSVFDSSLKDSSVDTCYYPGKRYPPNHREKYILTSEYWYEIAIRLLTIVIFEHVLLLLTGIIAYAIPDIPFSVKEQITYRKQKQNELQMKLRTENQSELDQPSVE